MFGRKENNLVFRKNPDIDLYLPSTVFEFLPDTTQLAGLFAVSSSIGLAQNPDASAEFSLRFSNNTREHSPLKAAELWRKSNKTPASEAMQESVISTRFSAPGGPEIQSLGYLDVYSQEYSAYNALPFNWATPR